MHNTTGIYEIKNTVNGKRYVGSAVDFGNRWRQHARYLARGNHHSIALQRAWRHYGQSAFQFNKLLICSKDNLIMYEQACMDALNPEYNCAPKAGSCLGVKHTPEFCKALGDRKRGQKHSEETKRLISEKIKAIGGRPHTEESRRSMSAAQKGKKTPHLAKLAEMKIGVPRPMCVRITLSKKSAKISEDQVREVRRRFSSGEFQKNLAREMGIAQSCVSEIVRGVTYAWVS